MTDKVPTPEEAADDLVTNVSRCDPFCIDQVPEANWCLTCKMFPAILAALRTQREALPEGHRCSPKRHRTDD